MTSLTDAITNNDLDLVKQLMPNYNSDPNSSNINILSYCLAYCLDNEILSYMMTDGYVFTDFSYWLGQAQTEDVVDVLLTYHYLDWHDIYSFLDSSASDSNASDSNASNIVSNIVYVISKTTRFLQDVINHAIETKNTKIILMLITHISFDQFTHICECFGLVPTMVPTMYGHNTNILDVAIASKKIPKNMDIIRQFLDVGIPVSIDTLYHMVGDQRNCERMAKMVIPYVSCDMFASQDKEKLSQHVYQLNILFLKFASPSVFFTFCSTYGTNVTDGRFLKYACKFGRLDIIQEMVKQRADIHYHSDAPLRNASAYGYHSIVTFLLDNGADIHGMNDSALAWASENGHLHIVACLLARGSGGIEEAIHQATKHGHTHIVNYLTA